MDDGSRVMQLLGCLDLPLLIVRVPYAGSCAFRARAIDVPLSTDIDRASRSGVSTTREDEIRH